MFWTIWAKGVLKPDIYDPIANPLYADLLAHYGASAMPFRVGNPDRKGKVERSVGHAKQTPLRGLRFESLQEAQTYLDRWEERWADTRIHGTTKRQGAAMFAEEKPALLPLPSEPFRFYRFGERGVNLDGCVEVDAAYYSTPPGWIGRQVKVQWDERTVRVLDPRTEQLLREHMRQERGRHRILDEDKPAHVLPSTTRLLARCEADGCIPARSASACTAKRVWSRSAAFRASSRWPRSTGPCWPTTAAPPPSTAASLQSLPLRSALAGTAATAHASPG